MLFSRSGYLKLWVWRRFPHLLSLREHRGFPRAHNAGSPRPRVLIIKFLNFQDKVRAMRAARTKGKVPYVEQEGCRGYLLCYFYILLYCLQCMSALLHVSWYLTTMPQIYPCIRKLCILYMDSYSCSSVRCLHTNQSLPGATRLGRTEDSLPRSTVASGARPSPRREHSKHPIKGPGKR